MKQLSSVRKRQPEWQDSNECMCCQQYISMLWPLGLKEDSVKWTPPRPIFAPPWIQPLAYLVKTNARMVAFQVLHMSPAKYIPSCDYQVSVNTGHRRTDRQTDRHRMVFVSITKIVSTPAHFCYVDIACSRRNPGDQVIAVRKMRAHKYSGNELTRGPVAITNAASVLHRSRSYNTVTSCQLK